MNRKPTRTPIDTSEWFSGAIYHLTKSVMVKIWNVSDRTMERWSADAAMTEYTAKNPIMRLGITLEKLMEKGKVEFARSCVDSLARTVRCYLVAEEVATPDKPTIAEEMLDDIQAIAAFHKSIDEKQPEAIVRGLLREAHQELDEDYHMYLKNIGQK